MSYQLVFLCFYFILSFSPISVLCLYPRSPILSWGSVSADFSPPSPLPSPFSQIDWYPSLYSFLLCMTLSRFLNVSSIVLVFKLCISGWMFLASKLQLQPSLCSTYHKIHSTIKYFVSSIMHSLHFKSQTLQSRNDGHMKSHFQPARHGIPKHRYLTILARHSKINFQTSWTFKISTILLE